MCKKYLYFIHVFLTFSLSFAIFLVSLAQITRVASVLCILWFEWRHYPHRWLVWRVVNTAPYLGCYVTADRFSSLTEENKHVIYVYLFAIGSERLPLYFKQTEIETCTLLF